jgi:hypothetical protein
MGIGSSVSRRTPRRRRPTPAFVLAALALFVALGSVAQATHPGGANTISKEDIIDGEVRSPEIASGSVTTGKISNSDGVRSEDVRDDTQPAGGLTSSDIAANALTGADIDESSLAVASAGFGINTQAGFTCDPNTETFATCAATQPVATAGDDAVLVIATGGWHGAQGAGVEDRGTCKLAEDGIDLSNLSVPQFLGQAGDQQDATDLTDGFAITGVVPNATPGSHTYQLRCNEGNGDIKYDDARISALAIGD